MGVDIAKTLSSEMYHNNQAVNSQLVTGAGWYRTLNWLIETDNGLTEDDVLINSGNWGNYADSTGNAAINCGDKNINYTTGRSEYWKANNIYDLAGNSWEWTQQTKENVPYALGGCFYDAMPNISAVNAYDIASNEERDYLSFRVQLYIQ